MSIMQIRRRDSYENQVEYHRRYFPDAGADGCDL